MILGLASAAAETDPSLEPDEQKQRAQAYAERAIALLQLAIKGGYGRTKKGLERFRSDPNLDPLRDRLEFKALMRRLQQDPPTTGRRGLWVWGRRAWWFADNDGMATAWRIISRRSVVHGIRQQWTESQESGRICVSV